MRLKKPDKDHRGEWDLVLDNEGTMVAALRYAPTNARREGYCWMLWPIPHQNPTGCMEWQQHGLARIEAVLFFRLLGVDTAPLEKLMEEKET